PVTMSFARLNKASAGDTSGRRAGQRPQHRVAARPPTGGGGGATERTDEWCHIGANDPVGAPSGPILLKFLWLPNEKSWQLLMALMPAPLRARGVAGPSSGPLQSSGVHGATDQFNQPWRGNVMPASRYIGSFLLAAGCALVPGGHSAHAQGAFTI